MASSRHSGHLTSVVLTRVLEVARALSASADLSGILSVIIDAMRDLLDAERATVFEYDPASDELFSTVAHGLEFGAGGSGGSAEEADGGPAEIRFSTAHGIAGECFRSRKIINVPDAYADERFNRDVDRESGFRTRSILAIPLMGYDGDCEGVAQILNKRDGPFSAADESLANALSAQAAVAVRRGRLIEDSRVRTRLQRELELAREIQRGTLPDTLPEVAGFELAAWCTPAEETGGDALDVMRLPDGSVLMLVADATGHGVGPALAVTQLRSMVRMAVRLGADLSEVARLVNEQLHRDLPMGKFITAWFGRIDATTGALECVSTGQAPILWYRAREDEIREFAADGLPLGITDEMELPAPHRCTMHSGDVFAVLSDGIYEARGDDDELFGTPRVEQLLRDARTRSAQGIADAVRDAVDQFGAGRAPDDDRTVLILKRT